MTGIERTVLASLIILAAHTGAAAQSLDLSRLKVEHERLLQLQDSLCIARASVTLRADSISYVLDSLKMHRAFDLEECQLESMRYLRKLAKIDAELNLIHADSTAIVERLRTAYEWQISQLLRMMSEMPDGGLMRQLEIYQEERLALGADVAQSQMRFPERMSISEEDGPSEIRQKIEYLEALAERFTVELNRIYRKLATLEKEDRMVDIMWVTVTQGGGDGSVISMRGTQDQVLEVAADGIDAARVVMAADNGSDGQGQRIFVRQRAVSSVPRWSSEIILRRRQLKAQQQEKLELLAVVEERISTFRAHLDELLSGVN